MRPSGMLKGTAFVIAVAIALASSQSWAVLIDYNTLGDLSAKFNRNHAGAGDKYVQHAFGGLGDSGSVGVLGAVDGAHTSAVYKNESFDFSSPGNSVTVSHFFLRQDATLTITNFSVPQVGILTDNTELFGNNAAGNSYASLRLLSSTANTTDVFIQTEIKSGTGTRQQNIVPGAASLIAGNWYRFSTTVENVSATQVRITGELENWGTTGSSWASTLLQLTNADSQSLATFSGGDLVLGDSSVWAGWRAFAEGGVARLDNFEATPEPASIALLLVGGLLIRRRR